MSADINELAGIIHELHGGAATHVQTVSIKEEFQGQTVWEGEVEVFDLADHPKASRVYAWRHETDEPDKPRTVTVLHVPPITSPRRAVQASIVHDYRRTHERKES